MTPNLRRKLEALAERHEEVGRLLADPGVISDNTRYRTLSREYSQLDPVVKAMSDHAQAQSDLASALADSTSTLQPWRSAYRQYIRNRSPAKIAASSPPVPARTSR